VSVSNVLEVLQKQHITKVPKTPEHILGIINFRGDILPVIDTRKKFNMMESDISKKQIVVVFEVGEETEKSIIAATADNVKDVIEINENEIKPVPELGLTFDAKFVTGAVHRDENFLLMLDVEKLFSNSKIVINL
jgi:purine-binding chemotaxis protein CheW